MGGRQQVALHRRAQLQRNQHRAQREANAEAAIKIGFEKALVGEGGKVAFLFSFGIALCLFGLSRDSFQDILSGLWRILIEPDYLISDYMDVGGMGGERKRQDPSCFCVYKDP